MATGDLPFEVAGATHVGRERQRNEDQFLIARLERRLRVESTSVMDVAPLLPAPREGILLLVADGMGGGSAGDVASSVAVRTVVDYVVNVMPWAASVAPTSSEPPSSSATLPGVRKGLTSALQEGDEAVRRMADDQGGRSMGTTATLAYIQWPFLYVAHVGDSRCYIYRDGELLQLTTDHTLAERLRERTDITIDDSSPWHHVLWNALGAGEHAEIEPEVHRHRLEEADTVLVCSDGLTKHVDELDVEQVIARAETAAEACERMVELANEGGGSDNITAVVAIHQKDLDEHTIDSEAPTRAMPALDTRKMPPNRDTEPD